MSRSIVVLFAALLLPAFANAADVSGTWKSTFETQIGQQNYTYTFIAKGAMLTGKANWGSGESQLTEGKVSGDTITFVEMFEYEGNAVKIIYTGKVVSTDKIEFSREVTGITTEELIAQRVK